MQYFKIGDVIFSWNDDIYKLPKGQYIERFREKQKIVSDTECFIKCNARFLYESEKCINNVVYECLLYEIHETKNGKMIAYHCNGCRFGYGFYIEHLYHTDKITYFFDPIVVKNCAVDADRFFSTAGMHSWLLKADRLVLHASYVLWRDQAILFTAPSQTGKSTQARLWVEHEKAEIMNEDRVLLGKREERWMAYGYPCSGSSPICVNHTAPLRAIVVLEQGPDNEIVPMSLSEKVRALVSGSEVYIWNQDEIDAAFRIAQQLIMEVPVIKLRCRPDRQAVEVLKNYLEVMSDDAI